MHEAQNHRGGDLAERIRAARNRAGMTQAQLARSVGVSREAVSQWEAKDPTKRTAPNNVNLAKVARTCRVSMDWLSGHEHDLLLTDGSGRAVAMGVKSGQGTYSADRAQLADMAERLAEAWINLPEPWRGRIYRLVVGP